MNGTLRLHVVFFSLLAAATCGVLAEEPPRLPYAVADTGQDRCYGEGVEIADPAQGAPFFGQDGQYEGNAPAYRNNGDSTVTDLVTGLVWQKTPDSVTRTWEGAGRYARDLRLAGHDDWRLPTIKELFSIADLRGNMRTRTPYIDTKAFDFRYPDPATGARDMDAQYWSSDKYVGTTMGGDTSAFGFNFADGRIKSYPIRFGRDPRRSGVKKYVRCVRGRPYGRNDFVDNGDSTVTDRATGLTWMKGDSKKPMNWKEALAFAESLEHAGHDDWRLPNVKELQTLVDYSRAPDARDAANRGPAIDDLFVLTEKESWFWTSTTHIENQFAYYVCFGRAFSAWVRGGEKMNAHGAGAVRSDPKSGDPSRWKEGHGPQGDEIRILNFVRCVRGGTATLRPSARAGRGDFSVVTVGTGSPKFNPERASASALIRAKGALILVDMGNGTQARLEEAGVSLGELDALLFTHHHLDHNEEFAPILIRSRLRRGGGEIVGPPGTRALTDFVFEFFKEDIAYRAAKTGRTVEDIRKGNLREIEGGEDFELFGVKIRTAKVVHTIHTVAYRFDLDGASIVISGDTCYSEDLVALAKGADILVMDSGGVVKKGDARRPGRGDRPGRQGGSRKGKKERAHCTLEEVASIAEKTAVKKLVLTHFGPEEVDEEATRKVIAESYPGEILFAKDLIEFFPGEPGGKAPSEAPSSPGAKEPPPADSRAQRFIRRLDKDGDGRVSLEEFDGPDHHFHRLDKNGDGYLDADEVPQGPPGGGRRGGRRGR
ncbi:MAG: Lcl domain-containing protein [Planctomycetota bacterium]|jgi:ribonuclease BN (tRNA processing enzyme)